MKLLVVSLAYETGLLVLVFCFFFFFEARYKSEKFECLNTIKNILDSSEKHFVNGRSVIEHRYYERISIEFILL